MTRGIGGQASADIQQLLSGVDAPASKGDHFTKAKQDGAPPEEVVRAIRQSRRDESGGPRDGTDAYAEEG